MFPAHPCPQLRFLIGNQGFRISKELVAEGGHHDYLSPTATLQPHSTSPLVSTPWPPSHICPFGLLLVSLAPLPTQAPPHIFPCLTADRSLHLNDLFWCIKSVRVVLTARSIFTLPGVRCLLSSSLLCLSSSPLLHLLCMVIFRTSHEEPP